MARTPGGSSTPATLALTRAGVEFTVHAYDHDPRASSYGTEAADALGLDPDAVLKTLVCRADEALVVAVVPVSGALDLKALARSRGASRARLADPADAERATGYVLGAISPLGQRRRLPTVLDLGALEHDRVYVSGGRRGLDLGLDPADLVRSSGAEVAALSRRSSGRAGSG